MTGPALTPPLLFAIAAGGAIGSVARYILSITMLRGFGAGFPWGTLTVNVLGSLIMGVAAGLFAKHLQDGAAWRAFVMVGVLGGFTTFSTFSLDVAVLAQRGELLQAAGYIAGSVTLSILALVSGLALARIVSP